MNGKPLFWLLRSVGWFFGAGAALFMTALVLVVFDRNLLLWSIVFIIGGALLWSAFATSLLTLQVELAEAPRKNAATRK